MKKYLFFSVILSTFIIACKTNPPIVAETQEQINYNVSISAEELKQGENLYTHNCGTCHKLFPAQKFTAVQWKPIVASMKPKAKVTDAEADLIEKYLSANSK